MAENLNFAAKGSRCYEDKPENCEKYGRLYDWATAMDIDIKFNNTLWNGNYKKHRGICPKGWHLLSYDEYEVLVNTVGGKEIAGKKLKSSSGWYNDGVDEDYDDACGDSPCIFKCVGNGTDEFGFSALPVGCGNSEDDDDFNGVGSVGHWWSASESNSHFAYHWYVACDIDSAEWYTIGKNFLFSVRCIQD
jgi:uncharacterized protein (TIGR02145 family)